MGARQQPTEIAACDDPSVKLTQSQPIVLPSGMLSALSSVQVATTCNVARLPNSDLSHASIIG